ncbi:MAG: FKBP-type peptidyl-prolyl cis-trans isomerase [Geobacteraceae bacterium]|nr:FKBP-type peptidyl-prolyl cis-trans isomerase [Geobacteraceae bacterium]
MILLTLSLLSEVCRADEPKPFTDQTSRESYFIGYEFGGNLRNQKIDVDLGVLMSAIHDGLKGAQPRLDPEESRKTRQQLQRKLLVVQNQRKDESASKNKEDGMVFLLANKRKEGVKSFPDGLQYKVLVDGSGPVPNGAAKVKVNYRGTLINGTEFDSSYSRGKPVIVDVNRVNAAWSEVLQRMKTGSKWQIFVPSELAGGERQSGRIPPNSTLIYELELVSIEQSEN